MPMTTTIGLILRPGPDACRATNAVEAGFSRRGGPAKRTARALRGGDDGERRARARLALSPGRAAPLAARRGMGDGALDPVRRGPALLRARRRRGARFRLAAQRPPRHRRPRGAP